MADELEHTDLLVGSVIDYGQRDREHALQLAVAAKPRDHFRSADELVADARVFAAYLNEPLPPALHSA